MPRKSKTQKMQTAPNQAYGVANEQKQAMQVVPLPNKLQGPDMSAPVASPDAATANEPMINGQAPSPIELAMQEMPPSGNAFSDPTSRPDESVLTPPTMQKPPEATSRVAAMFRMIATNSPNADRYLRLADLAERNRI